MRMTKRCPAALWAALVGAGMVGCGESEEGATACADGQVLIAGACTATTDTSDGDD
jgi:hypothetical protein